MNELQAVPPSELEPASFGADKLGRLFTWKGRLLRGISAEYASEVRALFHTGLMRELIDRDLFVNSWVTEYTIDGFALVVEHERIRPQTYPYEWTFSMLKDSALTVLEINKVAARFGYQTIDAHGLNVLFHKNRPLFVDLGSFLRLPDTKGRPGWFAYEEFLRAFYYPLRLWSRGNPALAARALLNAGFVPSLEYIQCQSWFAQRLPMRMLKPLLFVFFSYKQVKAIPEEWLWDRIAMTPFRRRVIQTVLFLRKRGLLLFAGVNVSALARKTRRLRLRRSATTWQDYQNELFTDSTPTSTPRMDFVVEAIKTRCAKTVVDLGGNQGLLAALLLERTDVEHIVSCDFDASAVDRLYIAVRDKRVPITPVLMNCMFPLRSVRCTDPAQRFRSEAVVALALSHHLILSQGMPVAEVFRMLGQYTSKYVLVEFMPLGLWNGERAPTLPDGYTRDGFRSEFARCFDLQEEVELEENRILFIGRVRSSHLQDDPNGGSAAAPR